MVSHPRLDEVWLIGLDPTQGSEIQKTRPCLVVSPDEINRHLQDRYHRSNDNFRAAVSDPRARDVPKQERTGGLGPNARSGPPPPSPEAGLGIGEDCAGCLDCAG